MKTWFWGIVCVLSACGGSGSDDGASDAASEGASDASSQDVADAEPDVIVTTEVCKVAEDCKMAPGRAYCQEPKTAIRYDDPICGSDQRCIWHRIEVRCGYACEAGICLSAR